jgi:hypothetical protein
MRILTSAAQIRRVAGLSGDGDFPDYPYRLTIPSEVGEELLEGLDEIVWNSDRDFLNDDGGYIVIFDSSEEFENPVFGLLNVDYAEEVRWVKVAGSLWWLCLFVVNNETTVEFVFRHDLASSSIQSKLQQNVEVAP